MNIRTSLGVHYSLRWRCIPVQYQLSIDISANKRNYQVLILVTVPFQISSYVNIRPTMSNLSKVEACMHNKVKLFVGLGLVYLSTLVCSYVVDKEDSHLVRTSTPSF